MFSCPECGKSYLSQNSLSRHLHNHSMRTNGHRCPMCELVFSRRDLMVRHKAIHENALRTARRRCHTACEPCRNSHEKCNGESPCDICHIRKQHCVYGQRSRRVSHPVSGGVTGVVEARTRPMETNSEVPRDYDAHPAPTPAQKSTAVEMTPWSPIDNTSLMPMELDAFAKNTNRQGNDTDVLHGESHGSEANDKISQDHSDFSLPDLPELLPAVNNALTLSHDNLENATPERSTSGNSPLSWAHTTLEQSEPDIFAKTSDQQDTHIPDMTEDGGRFDEIYSATSLDYSDLILPDLPEILMGDDEGALEHDLVRNASLERGVSDGACTRDVDNILYQPTDPDIFTSFLRSPGPTLYGPHLELNGIPNGNRPIFQEICEPLSQALPILGKQNLGHSAHPIGGDKSVGPNISLGGEPRTDGSSERQALIREIVDYAITSSNKSPEERRSHWEYVSAQVGTSFGIAQPIDSQEGILIQMVHLYKKNLLPLWPMICEKNLENPISLHPVLFLVAVSSGAMYLDGHNASVFGKMMQRCLQTTLITSFFEQEITEADTLWLAQARATIQVVALYFGQGQELVCAQRLGAVLVSQSRHMKLFTQAELEEFSDRNTPEEQVATWVQMETRRRVAFGIYRADVFLSLLLNCPPSISADELEISLPYPDSLWRSIEKLPPARFLAALKRERMNRDEPRFCDLIRILLDRDEVLLNMDARNYELLLFGLQEQVWKFSHDPEMFQRLIGHSWQDDHDVEPEIDRAINNSALQSRDHLQVSYREMKDLIHDRRRLSKALEKWNQSFNASRFRPGFNQDRGRILSSLLLFHIYHLQLNASLDVLHHIADARCNKTAIDYKKLQMAIRWAHSVQARNATNHASKIWSLLDNEAKMNPMKKPRYTMLSFIGLHHASVVLWACFGARRAPEPAHSSVASNDMSDGDQHDRPDETLMSIALLYSRLKSMSWDAFAESARRLSCQRFPRDRS